MTNEEINKITEEGFEVLFAEWLKKNPTFADKGENFILALKTHCKYWYLLELRNQAVAELLK